MEMQVTAEKEIHVSDTTLYEHSFIQGTCIHLLEALVPCFSSIPHFQQSWSCVTKPTLHYHHPPPFVSVVLVVHKTF